jgi:CYTH domain-containing protein
MGPFLCGVTSVYYLKKGKHPIRPYLPAAAYFATQSERAKARADNRAAYLVTDDLNDLRELINKMGILGFNHRETQNKVNEILGKMYQYFLQTFNGSPYYSNWERYLRSRAIIKTAQGVWVKDLGPKKANLTDSSIRMGHIVIGEALSSLYLLLGSGKFSPEKDIFYYLFPLMDREDVKDLDKTLTRDKEWLLLRKAGYPWRIITLDELQGVDSGLRKQIIEFKNQNRNYCKGDWQRAKESIREKLTTGQIKIADSSLQ